LTDEELRILGDVFDDLDQLVELVALPGLARQLVKFDNDRYWENNRFSVSDLW
jgi:hypothetical protein